MCFSRALQGVGESIRATPTPQVMSWQHLPHPTQGLTYISFIFQVPHIGGECNFDDIDSIDILDVFQPPLCGERNVLASSSFNPHIRGECNISVVIHALRVIFQPPHYVGSVIASAQASFQPPQSWETCFAVAMSWFTGLIFQPPRLWGV